MVKIANLEDLQKLKDYGFIYDDTTGKYHYLDNRNNKLISINRWNGKIGYLFYGIKTSASLEMIVKLSNAKILQFIEEEDKTDIIIEGEENIR